jgi:D-alanine-D-alanine ligase
MRIGITCNIQGQSQLSGSGPDDAEEEFDKPETVEAIAAVLRSLGNEVVVLGDGRVMLSRILSDPPDFVFNFAEGTGVSRSREARVPAVLEMLEIPYSGSDPLALAVTLDKDCCKRLVESAAVRTPKWITVPPPFSPTTGISLREPEPMAEAAALSGVHGRLRAASISFPVIVKPAYEGSSKGIREKSLVETEEGLLPVLRELFETYRQPVLVEEFISGDEVTVGVVGNNPPRVLGLMGIVPQHSDERDRFVYSLAVKRDFERRVRYDVPPNLSAGVIGRIERAAIDAYRVLGCRDVARMDFRVLNGDPFLLEVNPLPGLNPDTGDLVLLARGMNVSHSQLVEIIFEAACERYGLESRTKNSNFSIA